MTATGLLIAGRKVLVDGVEMLNAEDGLDWCRLHPEDYRARRGRPHIVMPHTTGGKWPQYVRPGAGKRGHAEEIAKDWSGRNRKADGNKVHSGAPILIDFDGSGFCLQDVVYNAAYACELANDACASIELCTMPDGSIYEATIDSGVRVIRALCVALEIPYQVHAAPYHGEPLARCETGRKTSTHDGRVQTTCADIYGIIQHRDQTSERGRGDAGDATRDALIADGAEPLDYSKSEDLTRGRARQTWLNAAVLRRKLPWPPLVVDGLVGGMSLRRAEKLGYVWRDVPLG